METKSRYLFHHDGGQTIVGVVHPSKPIMHIGICDDVEGASRTRRRLIAKLRAVTKPVAGIKINEEVDGDNAAKAFFSWCEDYLLRDTDAYLRANGYDPEKLVAESMVKIREIQRQARSTHEVLDLLEADYSGMSVVSVFKGTEEECKTWLSAQTDYFTYKIAPLRDAHTAV